MSIKGKTITLNGVDFNVVVEGQGPAVLLLHGFPDSAYLWRNQIPYLVNAGYQVIVPDQRGFGDSEAPLGKQNYAFSHLLADLIALMDHLGIERASVVGHDWGAVVGWYLTLRHPDRVKRYVTLSVGHPTAYRNGGPEQLLRGWYVAMFLVPGLVEKTASLRNWYMLRTTLQGHPELDHWIADLSRPGRLTAALNWYRANVIGMLTQPQPPVKVPTLGIWSTGDLYLSEKQMLDSAAYVDADWQYRSISGASHWIQLDAPQELNALLHAYFQQQSK